MTDISYKMTKNDEGWERLFKHFNIVNQVNENGMFEITSTEINTIGKREARLMTKFDHENNLPQLFQENELSILPNSRGTYLIGRFKTHVKLKYADVLKPIKVSMPREIQSISADNITSEAVALNVAHASGMIDQVIKTTGDNNSFLTLSGRLGSKELNFSIDSSVKGEPKRNITVQNSQIEIDASYENLKNIGVFEAKNKVPNDFLIRQLYYPYLYYENMNLDKRIKPIFFTYAENIFSFHIYKFLDINNYSSIKRINQLDFILDKNVDLSFKDLLAIYNNSPTGTLIEDIEVPFPQADNFLRVLDLLSLIANGPKAVSEIALNYGFAVRQSDYYFNALKYLGYAIKPKRGAPVTITDKGKYICKLKDTKKGKVQIIQDILSHKVFAECMQLTLEKGEILPRDKAKSVIDKYRGHENINNTTKNRRGSTVRGWLNWILNIVTDNN